MNWLKNLFGKKKPEAQEEAFKLVIDKDGALSISTNRAVFSDYVRNNYPQIDVKALTDREIEYFFLFILSKTWLADNASKPFFVEEHTFETSDNIKYERAWNSVFEQKVSQLGFDTLPSTGEELIEMYLNYLYGTRLMEEAAAAQDVEPTSVAHPQLTFPGNTLKD